MSSLLQIHIGKILPEYIYDSLYQSLLITNVDIYVLLDFSCIKTFNERIKSFNINSERIKTFPLNKFENNLLQKYKEYIKKFNLNFRDDFWISTTSRFFYIEEFVKQKKLNSIFHIENDVMLYEDLNNIKESLKIENEMYMVQDSVDRVVPSIIYIPNFTEINLLNNYILERITNSNLFLNDMNLLGNYTKKQNFNLNFNDNGKYIFDGAAIGQFLGGVDPRNLQQQDLLTVINNPSKGFINETSDFKINKDMIFFRKNVIINKDTCVDIIYSTFKTKIKQICNLHIHSKQLYQFSSIFDIKFNDIITGDRVLSLCDYILTTPEIYNYHKNPKVSLDKFIIVQNFKNINFIELNKCFNKKHIKLFIYTHILDYFIEFILDYLPKNVKFTLYLHNSDHSLNKSHIKLINDKNISKIYSQNIQDVYNKKISLLPIGLANNMFKHGDIISLYTVMSKTYNLIKTKNIYININPNTFFYRTQFIDICNDNSIKTSLPNKPFEEYLYELSENYFCLALRGNGLASHREIEALYLNVIPVFINNKYTNMKLQIEYFKHLNLPFFEITDDNLDDIIDKYFKTDFFNKELYLKLTNNKPINMNNSLKLSNYI
jgi:hypothetical protein